MSQNFSTVEYQPERDNEQPNDDLQDTVSSLDEIPHHFQSGSSTSQEGQ